MTIHAAVTRYEVDASVATIPPDRPERHQLARRRLIPLHLHAAEVALREAQGAKAARELLAPIRRARAARTA